MLKNLYVLIIIIPIVQITLCKRHRPFNGEIAKYENHKYYRSGEQVRQSAVPEDTHYFDSVVEKPRPDLSQQLKGKHKLWTYSKMNKRSILGTSKQDQSYNDIKILLSKVLAQLSDLQKGKREEPTPSVKNLFRDVKEKESKQDVKGKELKDTKDLTTTKSSENDRNVDKKKHDDVGKRTRWGHWTDWSSCSVSCGKGRQIRWRHCLEHCEEAETEMEEKTCQLPACGPGKLFGVISI